jgi:hypothetical protein
VLFVLSNLHVTPDVGAISFTPPVR